MAAVARFNNRDGDFIGLLINETTQVEISETTELGDTNVVVIYNGKRHVMSGEYDLEEVIQTIDDAAKK